VSFASYLAMCDEGAMTSLRVWCWLAVVTLAIGTAPDAGFADDTPDAGGTLYTRYCASCHGSAGRGDGPVAAELAKRPTDLTTLSYDVATLMKIIDGRKSVRVHGTSAMPVWGYVFEESLVGAPHRLRTVLHELRLLAEYTHDLQKPH
jgi:mono/diheme cytochrome c family protein